MKHDFVLIYIFHIALGSTSETVFMWRLKPYAPETGTFIVQFVIEGSYSMYNIQSF